MRFTLTHKYVGSLFGALITCCVVVLFVSIHYMKEPIEEELDGNIRRMQNVMRITNEITAMRFAQSAALLAREERLTRPWSSGIMSRSCPCPKKPCKRPARTS